MEHQIKLFEETLQGEEKSPLTVEKYLRDVRHFCSFAQGQPVTKALTMAYKQQLMDSGYGIRSINSMLASLNSFLRFLGKEDCRVRNLRQQREIYCPRSQELTKGEYLRLLEASKADPRLHLVLQTICATGIRISELRSFTMEAVRTGQIRVSCKNKNRVILLPAKLKRLLLQYAAARGIRSGVIFVTRGGKPLDRSNVWAQMKRLCVKAGVAATKVFPHNLRKLFARTFYAMDRDIARLADLLGHSSINTTRIYIMTTITEHQKKLERLGLLI